MIMHFSLQRDSIPQFKAKIEKAQSCAVIAMFTGTSLLSSSSTFKLSYLIDIVNWNQAESPDMVVQIAGSVAMQQI